MNNVTAIKLGDEFIFKQVFDQYHEKLYYFIVSKTKSTYIAEEVVQLTFIKLWQHRENLNEALHISSQLFRIAKTTLIDELRKQSNSTKLKNSMAETALAPYATEAFDTISAKEINAQLHVAMESLPPVRKKIFEMSRVKGMSYKEIATELSISPKTVENNISLAIKQLRHYFTLVILLFLLK